MEAIIRRAKKEDATQIFQLIRDLAEYEKALDHVDVTADLVEEHGFGPDPQFTCIVAELNSKVVGIAITYPRYSTWKGPFTYLEDLIVDVEFRNRGIGTLLLKAVIDLAAELNSARVEWQVLDWNESAIAFYRKFNATFDNEWINVRLTKDQFQGLR